MFFQYKRKRRQLCAVKLPSCLYKRIDTNISLLGKKAKNVIIEKPHVDSNEIFLVLGCSLGGFDQLYTCNWSNHTVYNWSKVEAYDGNRCLMCSRPGRVVTSGLGALWHKALFWTLELFEFRTQKKFSIVNMNDILLAIVICAYQDNQVYWLF